MGEKIRFALQKCKSVLIIVLILWVVLSIVLIAPVTISWVEAVNNNNGGFIDNLLGSDLSNVGANLSKAFSKEYRSFYLKNELYLELKNKYFKK